MSRSLCQVHQTFCLKSETSDAHTRCVNVKEATHTALGKVCAHLSWSAEHAVKNLIPAASGRSSAPISATPPCKLTTSSGNPSTPITEASAAVTVHVTTPPACTPTTSWGWGQVAVCAFPSSSSAVHTTQQLSRSSLLPRNTKHQSKVNATDAKLQCLQQVPLACALSQDCTISGPFDMN